MASIYHMHMATTSADLLLRRSSIQCPIHMNCWYSPAWPASISESASSHKDAWAAAASFALINTSDSPQIHKLSFVPLCLSCFLFSSKSPTRKKKLWVKIIQPKNKCDGFIHFFSLIAEITVVWWWFWACAAAITLRCTRSPGPMTAQPLQTFQWLLSLEKVLLNNGPCDPKPLKSGEEHFSLSVSLSLLLGRFVLFLLSLSFSSQWYTCQSCIGIVF